MAKTVQEIANFELFSVLPSDTSRNVLQMLMALGISSAPVISRGGQILGVVSWSDLVKTLDATAKECMSAPATTVQATEDISRAAEVLAETGHHHMAVMDGEVVVGYLSVMDVLRGLVGRPVVHPEAFPHYDRFTGLTWTNETELALGKIAKAPDGPGVFVLVQSGAGRANRVLWAEASQNVRTRLTDLLSLPQSPALPVDYWLDRGPVFFKAAAIPEGARRLDELLDVVRRRSSATS